MVDPLTKSLVTAAMELHRRRPWERVVADAPILLRIPGEEHALVGTIIGQGRGDYGLIVLRGEDAVACFEAMVSADNERLLAERGDMLAVNFDPLGTLPPEPRRLLKQGGFSGRREQAAPLIFVKQPGSLARMPGRRDLRLLLACVRAVLAADAAGELAPRPLGEAGGVLEVRVAGERRKGGPAVECGRVAWPERGFRMPAAGLASLDPGLGRLRRRDERWFIATMALPVRIGDSDQLVRAVAVFDEGSTGLRASELVPGSDLAVAARALEVACRKPKIGAPGLPRAIGFESEELHDALAPALAGLGVETSLVPEPEFVREALAALRESFRGRPTPEDSVEAWQDANRRSLLLLKPDAPLEERESDLLFARYFGREPGDEEELEALWERGAVQSFIEWHVADCVAGPGQPTALEHLLASGRKVPADLRAMLEARRTARLSIFRVDRCEPGAALEVVDILSGASHVIHDAHLSGSDLAGRFLILRLLKVGRWTLCAPAGPVLGPTEGMGALLALESFGVKLTRLGLRRDADKVGRLWMWHLEREVNPLAATNSDGEELRHLSARFTVASRKAFERGLQARKDLERSGKDRWTWRSGPGAEGGEERVNVLASLHLDGRSLHAEVNSPGRLERLCDWLEQIDGVRFEEAAEHPFEALAALKGSVVAAADLSPRDRAALEEVLAMQYGSWADERLPALHDLTPREACRTDEGRARVTLLVRAMPSAVTPWGLVAPPRDKLMAELGLKGRVMPEA